MPLELVNPCKWFMSVPGEAMEAVLITVCKISTWSQKIHPTLGDSQSPGASECFSFLLILNVLNVAVKSFMYLNEPSLHLIGLLALTLPAVDKALIHIWGKHCLTASS